MIPVEAVDAVRAIILPYVDDEHFDLSAVARAALEVAAPYMLNQVHHHDIERHARSFNEGYETAMAQELADNPTTAQDWLDERLAEARAAALEEAAEAWQIRMDTIGRGSVEAKTFMQVRAIAERHTP